MKANKKIENSAGCLIPAYLEEEIFDLLNGPPIVRFVRIDGVWIKCMSYYIEKIQLLSNGYTYDFLRQFSVCELKKFVERLASIHE